MRFQLLLGIERIFYPVQTLGPGKRLGIWTVGCSFRCFNCCNPELQAANSDKEVSLASLFEMVYTGNTLKKLQEIDSPYIAYVLNNISVLIDGLYIEAFNDNSPLKGSSNQEIHIFKEGSIATW